jgi:hypothetical protein
MSLDQPLGIGRGFQPFTAGIRTVRAKMRDGLQQVSR